MLGQNREHFVPHPWGGRGVSSSCCASSVFAARSVSKLCGGKLRTFLLILLITVLHGPLLLCQDFPPVKLQVGHDTWTFKDGAPEYIQALAQTGDGFLWLGTPNGLFRFDGSRFEPFRSPFGDKLLSTDVRALLAPASGGLWIGYLFGGFSFIKDGRVKNYDDNGVSTGTVNQFSQNQQGIVWAATNSGLWKFEDSSWQRLGIEWNIRIKGASQLGFDHYGTLWAIGEKTLIYLRPSSKRFQTAETNLSPTGFTFDADKVVVTSSVMNRNVSPAGESTNQLTEYPVLRNESGQLVDRSNGVWISSTEPVVIRLAASHESQGRLPKAVVGRFETYRIAALWDSALVDREGNVWMGATKGLHRFFYSPLMEQGFPKNAGEGTLFAVAPGDHGTVWISTGYDPISSGLYHVLSSKVQLEKRTTRTDLGFAYRAPDKSLWFGGEGGLWHLVGGSFGRIDLPQEMADQARFLQTITEDAIGGMWISFGRHGLYRLFNGVWTSYGGRQDLPKTGVVVEFTDSLDRVWFGCQKNTLALLDGDQVHVFGPSDGLHVGNVTAIYGRRLDVWIGGEFGLQQFNRGHFHNVNAINDEWLRGISGIVETAGGDLWLNGLNGIFHIPQAELSEALKNPTHQVRGEHFGMRQGLPGFATQIRPLPTLIEGTDGRLWFAVNNGVGWLNPGRPENRISPPHISIQSVSADDRSYQLAAALKFPAHTSSVQINYAATSLSDPETVRFRYKLQETDKDWHEVSAASPVSYRNLAPGLYHFTVDATDTNGVWSDAVATVEFAILPAFYQTRWFLFLCLIAAMAFLYFFYLLRLRQVAQQVRGRMEATIAERERIARDLHDTLLQSIQGLILKIHAISKRMPSADPNRQDIERTLDHADQVLAEGRDRVRSLRAATFPAADLSAAFQQVAEESCADSNTTFKTVIEGNARELHPMVREEAYSIGREAIINALTHSEGRNIEVEIIYESRELCLRIRDDGRGIDPDVLENGGRADHWGLQGMRERAQRIGGQLDIWSRPGSGTEVELRIPAATAYRWAHGKATDSRSRLSTA
jgi:ligand-binding sensor domain-containing protein